MDYDEFADRFLTGVYWETEHNNASFLRAGTIIDKYGLSPKPNWINRMADDWEHLYFKDISKTLGGYEGWSFRISAEGYKKVEAQFADEDEIIDFLEEMAPGSGKNQPQIEPDNSVSSHSASEPEIGYHPPVDSQDWTGIAARIDAAKLVVVKDQVHALLLTIDQSDCDERTKKNARKHAEAVVALLEAPDPPWKVIVELLNNPIFTAFLNTAAVLSLIFGS